MIKSAYITWDEFTNQYGSQLNWFIIWRNIRKIGESGVKILVKIFSCYDSNFSDPNGVIWFPSKMDYLWVQDFGNKLGIFLIDPESLTFEIEWGQKFIWSENNPSYEAKFSSEVIIPC